MKQSPKLPPIERLTTRLFQKKWCTFLDASFSDPELHYPGVYLLAYEQEDLEGLSIRETQVLYVGMSNAAGGVRSRLIQFRKGLETYGMHSGAMRFYREYQKSMPRSRIKSPKNFFYAATTIACISAKDKLKAADLRTLGHVACLEYYAIARIKEKTRKTPPLNKFGKRPALL